jgi:hypothetical protein
MEILRDRDGRVVGELRESGGVVKLYTVAGKYLGMYNKNTRTTYDASGAVYAKSNLLVALLRR